MADIQIGYLGTEKKEFMDKKEAHERIRESSEKGGVLVYDYHVQMLVFDPEGRLLVHQRSQDADDNGGLLDKSFGTHLYEGEHPASTIVGKGEDELGRGIVVCSDDSWVRKLREYDKSDLIIAKLLASHPAPSIRTLPDGSTWVEPCYLDLFVGYTSENIADGKADFQFLTQEEITAGTNRPRRFTEDLRALAKEQGSEFVSLEERFG